VFIGRTLTTDNSVSERLPLLPLRDAALKPGTSDTLYVGRSSSLAAIKSAAASGNRLFVVAQLDATREKPEQADFFKVGTVAEIMNTLRLPDGTVRIVINGLHWAELVSIVDASDHSCGQIRAVSASSNEETGVRLSKPPGGERPDDLVEEISVENYRPDILLRASGRRRCLNLTLGIERRNTCAGHC